MSTALESSVIPSGNKSGIYKRGKAVLVCVRAWKPLLAGGSVVGTGDIWESVRDDGRHSVLDCIPGEQCNGA